MLRVIRQAEGPIADFDLRYFMEVIQEFASDHDTLRSSLEGGGTQGRIPSAPPFLNDLDLLALVDFWARVSRHVSEVSEFSRDHFRGLLL